MPLRSHATKTLFAAAVIAAATTATASAKTLQVCKDDCDYKTIQKAVDASKKGDTVKVQPGTYNEGVIVIGHKHDKLKFEGSPKNPKQVKLIQKGLRGAPAQNAISVSGADSVSMNGFYAKGFKGNGFYVENANGYTMNHLIAERDGAYGLFAYNSIGGTMKNSTAYYFNDSGFYVGQTPRQRKPKRTKISHVVAYLNVLGYSGTNSKYVDIESSEWFNNGAGIVPNSLDSEKFPPNEDNHIFNNTVYWNNFNYYLGAPFKKAKTEVAEGEIPFPVGVGILLFGGRGNRVDHNSIFGNWLAGFAMVNAFQLKRPAQRPLLNNQVLSNDFGLSGADLNGRDIAYDGSGNGNCFDANTGVTTVFPADGSTIVPCTTPPQPNVFQQSAQDEAVNWTINDNHEIGWIPHPHSAQPGRTPIEHYGAS
jgi:hypothetical protein